MKRETIENILNFLKEKEGKGFPQNWNLIKELENHPDDIRYIHEGNLDLNDSTIRKLPNDLYVKGGLFLFDCKELTELPKILYVRDNLMLVHSNVAELPNKLYVGGNLHINNTPLAKKYTNKQIREIVASTGGQIIGEIFR